jgi:hypothetical protein
MRPFALKKQTILSPKIAFNKVERVAWRSLDYTFVAFHFHWNFVLLFLGWRIFDVDSRE